MVKELIQFWKGSENAYRELYIRGRIKDNIRYTVLQNDGTIKEYLGKKIINNGDLEQIAALDDAISVTTFQSKMKEGSIEKGSRLLVGDDKAFDEQGYLKDCYTPSESEKSLWYAIIFEDDITNPSEIIDFTNRTARLKKYGMKEYQVVDNMLTSYDHLVWYE